MTRLSYDERQIEPPLRTCLTCGKAFYMRAEICAQCGPGWKPSKPQTIKIDVSGHAMDMD